MRKIIWSSANPRILERWDDLVSQSVNGTLFHKHRFLAYHGNRFGSQERFLVAHRGDQVVALIPLAVTRSDRGLLAKSPYGGSYGGVVFINHPTYSEANRIISALTNWLRGEDIKRFVITQAPDAFHGRYLGTAAFCYHEHGFIITSRDVCSIVHTASDVDIRVRMTGNGRNMARKAEKAGVVIEANASLEVFWPLMEETYGRHGTRPTHERDQMSDLHHRCPNDIRLTVASLNGQPVAGVAEFRTTGFVNSSFYLCQNRMGAEVQALSLLVLYALERAQNEGYGLYDFGTSTVHMQARPNIFRFKESFGAEGVFRETMEWRVES